VTGMSGVQVRVPPAVGGGGRLSRKALIWRGLIALALVILLAFAKQLVTGREVGADPLSELDGSQVTAAGLDFGGEPQDFELQALAASYRVDGVVRLQAPSVAEQATAASLHLGYLLLTVAPGDAPTLTQLQTLATFMRAHTQNGNFVYLHDDVGGGRAVATASMLLLLRGSSWTTVQREMTAPALGTLSQRQEQAVTQLIAALQSHGKSLPGNPYAKARTDPW
jgi:hypothetical protein